jgi:hypothetical protein
LLDSDGRRLGLSGNEWLGSKLHSKIITHDDSNLLTIQQRLKCFPIKIQRSAVVLSQISDVVECRLTLDGITLRAG